MSPEQAAGEGVDSRSDLWSLGVVTYEMLAGRLPFRGTNTLAIIQATLTTTPEPIRTLRPDVAPELEEVLIRTLGRDRKRRTITASDVRDLAVACHTRLLSSGPQRAVARPRASRRALVAVATVVALAVGASGIAWWADRNAKAWWARQEAMPEIIRLAEAEKFDDAYRLAKQAEPYLRDDPLLAKQMTAISIPADIDSEHRPGCPGAIRAPADAWIPLYASGSPGGLVRNAGDCHRVALTRPAQCETRR